MYTRVRTKGSLTAIPPGAAGLITWQQQTQAVAAGTVPVYKDGPFVTTSDTKVPRFARRRADGETFCNDFKSVKQNRVVQDASYAHVRQTALYPGETNAYLSQTNSSALHSYASAVYSQTPLDPWGPDLEGIAIIASRNAKHRDVAYQAAIAGVAKTDALLLVSAVEFKKTVELLAHYASGLIGELGPLYQFYHRAMRGKVSQKEWTTIIPNEWMRLRYGLAPLLYEIQGVVNALAKPNLPKRQTARGNSSWSDTYVRTVAQSPTPSAYQQVVSTCTTTANATVKAGVLYEPLLDTLSARLGLHPSALPETALELVPFSWMADWFMNLSDSVRALTASVHGKFLVGWTTETVNYNCTHSLALGLLGSQMVTTSQGQKPTTWGFQPSPASATVSVFYTTKIRTPCFDMLPRMPRVRVNMNATRVADLLSVVAQRLAGLQGLANASSARKGVRL